MELAISLTLLAIAGFLQNMAFTWVSRARNGGDPTYLRIASVCSNGVWFVIQVGLLSTIWPALTQGEWWKIALTGLVYIVATTEGSVYMMRILLKKETGKRRVGASA
jgi:hypothetical protein